MDQSTEEQLVQSFEIIDEKELIDSDIPATTTTTITAAIENDDDGLNNNTIIPSSETITTTTTTTTTTTEIEPETEIAQNNNTENNEEDEDNNNNAGSNKLLSKKYSREQLIQMMPKPDMKIPPSLKKEVKNLLFTETSEIDNTLSRVVKGDAVTPKFMNSMSGRNSSQRPKSSEYQSRRSQQGNKNQPIITMRLQSNEEIKLNEAKNAWKPQILSSSSNEESSTTVLTEEEKKTEELIKQFRSILNKITPENFSTLIGKLKTLHIDTVERLDNCISLVFEKSITEPNYASSYALLCKEVSDVFIVPLDSNNAQQKAVFKKRLITQCQREFEKHRDNELIKNNASRLKKIEDEEDPVKKEELKNDFDYESVKVRKRAVGTVHFIGELYKIEMLTSKIMRSCIMHLLEPSMCSEETLECLCKLLQCVGKRLEKLDKNKVDLSEYFTMLEKLADKKNPIGISSRIRFMIQDVLELRLNNWTPRRIQRENKPLTMDEIKQQVILEQAIKNIENKDAAAQEHEKNNRNMNNQNARRTGAINEDGWSTSYSKTRPVKFDPLKLPTNASDDIKLGQPSNFQNFSNFQSNRFAGLKEEESVDQANRNYNGRFSGGAPNLNNNNNNNNSNRMSYDNRQMRNNNNNNNNNNRNNRSAGSKSLQASSMQGGGGNQKYGSSSSRNRHPSMQFLQRPSELPMGNKSNILPRKISAPARQMQYSEAFLQERNLIIDPNKVSNIFKSSLTGYQHNEITLEEIIEKLRAYRIKSSELVTIFNWAFDQHDNERLQLTEIICEGVSRNIITIRDLLDALKETIELAQDLACDLPLVYSYIGQFLALPLMKRIILIKDLFDISKSQIECENGENILKNVLRVLEQQNGKEELTQLYNDANFNIQLFLNENTSLDEFANENNFTYLIKQAQTVNEVDEIFDETLKTSLEQKLKNESDVEAIIQWITENIKEQNNAFIRVLMELILKNCIEKLPDGTYKLERDRLDFGASLLTQFVEKSKEKQIQCLRVIHRFMNELEHPQSCLNDILTCLYENFALSKSAFFKWHDDADPLEQEGKGVALKSIQSFIQFLKTEKDDNDDESTGEEC